MNETESIEACLCPRIGDGVAAQNLFVNPIHAYLYVFYQLFYQSDTRNNPEHP